MLIKRLTALEVAELEGQPVDHLFPVLLRVNEHIKALRFESFNSSAGISERIKNSLSFHKKWLSTFQGSSLETEPGISLWDKFASKSMAEHELGRVPDEVLDAVIRHSANPCESAFELSASEVSRGCVVSLIKQLRENQILAACSRVRVTASEDHHIPMLDFLCPNSEWNRASIVAMLRRIGESEGVIVESGRSYHYYGFRLLDRGEWIKFMARALMFAPFSDPRYIAHRLLDGQCRLRVYSDTRPVPRIKQVFCE